MSDIEIPFIVCKAPWSNKRIKMSVLELEVEARIFDVIGKFAATKTIQTGGLVVDLHSPNFGVTVVKRPAGSDVTGVAGPDSLEPVLTAGKEWCRIARTMRRLAKLMEQATVRKNSIKGFSAVCSLKAKLGNLTSRGEQLAEQRRQLMEADKSTKTVDKQLASIGRQFDKTQTTLEEKKEAFQALYAQAIEKSAKAKKTLDEYLGQVTSSDPRDWPDIEAESRARVTPLQKAIQTNEVQVSIAPSLDSTQALPNTATS